MNTGEIVGFDGMESDIDLNASVNFSARACPSADLRDLHLELRRRHPRVTGFAPGAPLCEAPWLSPCAASVFHAYTYGGAYTVTLTVTDVGGTWPASPRSHW